ncbi:hypothetical protein AVEN_175048-1, partial [Araneus ventricosus]
MELEPARGAESSATEQRQEEQFQKTQFHKPRLMAHSASLIWVWLLQTKN